VVVKHSFAVAMAVLIDEFGNIIAVASKKLVSTDMMQEEAVAALLAVCLAAFSGCDHLLLEGDALLVVLAINNPPLLSSWCFAHCISDISLILSSLHSWNAVKVHRCSNFCAHALAQWAASNHVFESIPKGSPIISSIRIRNGKDHSL
jgi:hypothetical protein